MDFDVITNNLKKSFEVWMENIVAYLAAMILPTVLIYIIIIVMMVVAVIPFLTGTITGVAVGMLMLLFILAVILLLTFFVVFPLWFSIAYMAVKGARGEKVEIRDLLYAFKSVSVYIKSWVAIIVLAVIFTISSIIPIIGPVICSILFTYAVYIYIMVPSEGIVYALTESFNIAKDNLAITIVAIIVIIILNSIGSLFVIGTIITMPISFIFLTFIIKELNPSIT